MKEFMIIKYYNIMDNSVEKYAIFPDGLGRKRIFMDEYGEYFYVDNALNEDDKSTPKYLMRSFRNRIFDAVDTIRNGDGDCIYYRNGLSRSVDNIYVKYYLDRHLGEELRKKSMDDWKNTQFGWSVMYGNMSGLKHICKDGSVFLGIDNELPILVFDDYDSAKKYVDEVMLSAFDWCKKLQNMLKDASDEKRETIIDSWMSDIEKSTGSICNITYDFAFDMLSEDMTLQSQSPKLKEMTYRIVQIVK